MAESNVKDEVCRVGVKVPPFWPNEPALWFVQLEGQFALANITADATKFYHVISNLDFKYVCEVKDVITNPPENHKYEKIKSELISRLSASQEQRVRQLLTLEELGERKPSQFLRHLRSLAGAGVPDDFIRSLWTSRLPSHIQAIIATQVNLPLDTVAQIVDKIHEVSFPGNTTQVTAVSAAAASSTASCSVSAIETLTQRIDDLSRQVANCLPGPVHTQEVEHVLQDGVNGLEAALVLARDTAGIIGVLGTGRRGAARRAHSSRETKQAVGEGGNARLQ